MSALIPVFSAFSLAHNTCLDNGATLPCGIDDRPILCLTSNILPPISATNLSNISTN